MQWMQLEPLLFFFHHILQIFYALWRIVFKDKKLYIRENDIAWQNQCADLELMVFDSFLQVTDNEIRKFIEYAEYV